jgi:probable phosphoglycerate mutase
MTAPIRTTLIIARHGNTFNPGEPPRRVGARTDLALTESGLAQAVKLGQHLAAQGLVPVAAFSSEQQRTRETASLALAQINPDIPRTPLAIFNELDYGPDENRPEDQVRARIGEAALRAWEDHAIPPPGWIIDVDQITRNWVDFARTIAADYAGETVLVVTSNGTARFAPHITGDFEAFRARFPLKLATGAYGVLTHQGDSWLVESWNIKPA